MDKYNDFSSLLSSYFLKHLPSHTGYSRNTVSSYRDTFVLLFRYHEQVYGKKASTIHHPVFLYYKRIYRRIPCLAGDRKILYCIQQEPETCGNTCLFQVCIDGQTLHIWNSAGLFPASV